MNRAIKIFLVLPLLVALWGYANTAGLTRTFTEAAGLPRIDTWTIPGLDKVLEAREFVDEQKQAAQARAQRAAVRALKAEVRRRYGPEAAALVPDDLPLSKVRHTDPATFGAVAEAASRIPHIALPFTGSKPGSKPGGAASPKGSAEARTNGNTKVFARALERLDDLDVKGRAPMTGYSRDQFGAAWSDNAGDFAWTGNGCDTRNDVLRRDLVQVTYDKGSDCEVATGIVRYEPYTGQHDRKFDADGAYEFTLDIEHVVALGNAWVTGAQQWEESKRAAIANDPLNLFAADPSSNRQKGDADAATWLPGNKAYRCAYVSRQIAVKTKYDLWVTAPEKAAMTTVLDGCLR